MSLKNIPKKLIWVILLSMVGTFNAIYLTIWAYKIKAVEVFWSWSLPTSFCDISSTFSCSSVFTFDFSWMFWIPFSLLAAFVYPTIIIIAVLWIMGIIKNHYKILLYISLAGLIFNWYVIVNESIVWVYCLLCLMCTWIIIAIWIMSHIGICEEKKLEHKNIFSKIKKYFTKK